MRVLHVTSDVTVALAHSELGVELNLKVAS